MLKSEQKEMYKFHPLYCLSAPSLDREEEKKDTTSPT